MTEYIPDAVAIIDVALASAGPQPIEPGGLYVAVVPVGHAATLIDDRDRQDARAERPIRRRGTATLTRAASFSDYVTAHSEPGAEVGPALFANDDAHMVQAVFNGPGPGTAGWGDDRAVLSLVTTQQWDDWTGMHGVPMTQKVLAEFLEEHLSQVVTPDGATLLEMVTTFEAMTNVEIQSVTRLTNGTRQLVWKEATTAKAGQTGEAEFPDAFLLELVPFEGMAPVTVGVRLRYSVTRDRGLSLTFLLDDTNVILRNAFDVILNAVEQAVGLVAYHGTPA